MKGEEARVGAEGMQFVSGEKIIVFVILVAQVLIYSWTASTINGIKDSVSKNIFQASSLRNPNNRLCYLLYRFRNFPKNVKIGWGG